jgi:acyl carrier protein phosphodiesterase
MNYLGHIFLSGRDEQLMIGNFIADSVKGKKYLDYPVKVQKGILLHRSIDHFTDNNIHWQRIREMIRPVYNRYAGVVTDLFIDHFLAVHWNSYSPYPLEIYSKWVNDVFLRNYSILPDNIQGFLENFIKHKRLLSYTKTGGIEEALAIMSIVTSLPNHTESAMNLLRDRNKEFEEISILFIADVIEFTLNKEKNKIPLRDSK